MIHAGAGGIGTFAIQLAKEMGAFVATTTSNAGKDLVQSLGADKIINYREEKFEEKLADYDYVYDTLGGDTLINSFKILKPDGKLYRFLAFPMHILQKRTTILFGKKSFSN